MESSKSQVMDVKQGTSTLAKRIRRSILSGRDTRSKKTMLDPGWTLLYGFVYLYPRRGSRILKWGVNFCNNVIEPKPG